MTKTLIVFDAKNSSNEQISKSHYRSSASKQNEYSQTTEIDDCRDVKDSCPASRQLQDVPRQVDPDEPCKERTYDIRPDVLGLQVTLLLEWPLSSRVMPIAIKG